MIVAVDTNCILPGRVGGIENYTLALIEALKRPGSPASKLLLLTRPENAALFSRFTDATTQSLLLERPTYAGSPVHNWGQVLQSDPTGGAAALVQFQRQKSELLHRNQVDVVHFPGNTINPMDLDLPVVLNLHDLQHRHFPQYFSADELDNRERWWNASARRADALIAASDYVRDDLVEQLHVSESKIFVTPDPFESRYFQAPPAEQLTRLREFLSLPDSFLIYPAAVWPHKNHERLIRAFVEANLGHTQLVLTGGGQPESALPRLIEDLQAEQKVRLLGRVTTEELVGLYHLATAMIFPSQHESWSIPVMEAMACGCPVVCSNVTSLPEEIGEAGLTFSPDDSAQMILVMRRICGDVALRRLLAERGRVRVRQYTAEHFLSTLSSAYTHACSCFRSRKAA